MKDIRDIQLEITSKINQFIEYANSMNVPVKLIDDQLIGTQPVLFDVDGMYIRNYLNFGCVVTHAYVTYEQFYGWVYSNEPDLVEMEQEIESIFVRQGVRYQLIDLTSVQRDPFNRTTVARIRFDVCTEGRIPREPVGNLTRSQATEVAKLIMPVGLKHKTSIVIPDDYLIRTSEKP